MLQMALRAPGARQLVTTTPRPTRLIRQLLADPSTAVTRGRTLDNAANLDARTLAWYAAQYAGSRLGRQELEGEVLDDIEGALWNRDQIDRLRVPSAPELGRILVAIDPAVSSAEDSDETGIVVVAKGLDGHGYVLEDLSLRASPDGWARRAVEAYRRHRADRIVAETNQGGDLVEATLRTVDPTIPYRGVRATHGKRRRAEPIAALYEQGRVHHVGPLPELEDQLCHALPDGGSGTDDRLDALVWGLTELGIGGSDLDVPGMIAWTQNIWFCRYCGHGFWWAPRRPCPRCRQPTPPTYDEPVAPAGGSDGVD